MRITDESREPFFSIPNMPRTTSRVSARPLDDWRKSPIASAPLPAADAAPFWRSVGFDGVSPGAGGSRRVASISRALWLSSRVPYFANNGLAVAAPGDVVGRAHA